MPARRPSRKIAIAAGLGVAFVVLVALAIAHSASKQSTTSQAGAQAPAAADEVAPIALRSVDGAPVRLPAGRPGALLFATATCSPCAASAEALGKAKEQLGSKVDAAFIGIDPSEPPEAMRALRSAVGEPPYPFAIDSTGSLYRLYRINALGTTIVYNAKGRIVARMIEPDLGQLEAAFRKAGVA
jgi:cytochrome oxidase Cu insertion factor (SCO1/SenC/PrrC family)